jgi:hypothetical protein
MRPLIAPLVPAILRHLQAYAEVAGEDVRDAAGRWIAALSVAGPLHGTAFQVDAAHLQLVVSKAAELSRRRSQASSGCVQEKRKTAA